MRATFLRMTESNRTRKLTTLIFSVDHKFFYKYLKRTRRNDHFLTLPMILHWLLFKILVTEAYPGIYRCSYSTFIWDTSWLSAGTIRFYFTYYIVWLLYMSWLSHDIYIIWLIIYLKGLPWWCSGWESACQCRGHGFEPWSGRIPHAAEQLGPWATATEPARLEPVPRNKRGRDSERPAHRDEEWTLLATTRESPHTETKTQYSQKLIN